MKYAIIFFSFLICSFNSNSQTIKKSDLVGKWYQCEESDGKLIKLYKEKCFTNSLNEDSARLIFNEYDVIDWEFNRLGNYSVVNHFEDSLSHNGRLNFNNNVVELDGIAYFFFRSDFLWQLQ